MIMTMGHDAGDVDYDDDAVDDDDHDVDMYVDVHIGRASIFRHVINATVYRLSFCLVHLHGKTCRR